MAEDIRTTSPIRWKGKDGTYEVVLRFAPVDGRMECVGVDVEAVPRGTRVVTAVALHSIPLGKLIEKRRPKVIWKGQEVSIRVTPATVAAKASVPTPTVLVGHTFTKAPTFPQGQVTRRVGRPPKYGPEHWQKVARIYQEAWSKNRTPTRAVARHFKVSETAAAKWVARCRALGLLPKTTRGKARAVVQARATGRVRLRSRATGKALPRKAGGGK